MGVSAFLMGVFFDFYFDLNDDTLMRDIMSGIYSGTPDGHNMQTLYPLGAAVALCYRLCGSFPWYGVFLLLCQFGCFFAVGVRLCTLADVFVTHWQTQTKNDGTDSTGEGTGRKRRLIVKLLCLLGVALFQWGIWLTHMVNVQYTITCGMLAGAAVFLFLTGSRIPPLLFFLLAFQLRPEMALLVLPFLGLAGAFCWWEERPVFTSGNLKKYGCLLLLLLAGMGISLGADALAYGGEWRTFRQFFDDRTTIYDFYPEVVTDDAYAADLESLGVSPAAQALLRNYDFGLDEEIDAQLLSDVAAYAKEHVGGVRDWSAVFKEQLFRYCYRSLHGGDAPYNLLVMLGYAANIITIVILLCRGVFGFHWEEGGGKTSLRQAACPGDGESGLQRRNALSAGVWLILLFLMRTALWMFILMRGREPERITHSLYLVEFCLLAGLFLRRLCRASAVSAVSLPGSADSAAREVSAAKAVTRKVLFPAAAAVCLLSAAGMTRMIPAVQADRAVRREAEAVRGEIDAYCRARQGVFFFEDVYSTVAFSGKLLERRDHTLANYDIAGGWICKSPLYQKKLAAFGIEEAADALLAGNAYFIMSDEESKLRGLDWLTACYAEKGIAAKIAESDRIGEGYGVYRIHPASDDAYGTGYAPGR